MNLQEAHSPKFKALLADVIKAGKDDAEFMSGLAYLRVKAQEWEITFDEMCFLVMQKHVAEMRAKEWRRRWGDEWL